MPLSQHPNNTALGYGWNLGESGWHDSYNGNFRALGVQLFLAVLSRQTSAQPSSPSEGDRYIVGSGATGAQWNGQDGNIAAFVDGAWRFYAPAQGWRAYVVDEGIHVHHTGSAWIHEPQIPPSFTDGNRPDPTTVPVGFQIFNTDDGAPNWSDGTDWVDATGATT